MPRPKVKRSKIPHAASSTSDSQVRANPQSSTVAKLRNSTQNHDALTSSDSDHLVRRKQCAIPQPSSQPEADATLMAGGLPADSDQSKARRKSTESGATRRVRSALDKQETARKASRLRDTTDKSYQNRSKGGQELLGWTRDEMAPSPVTSKGNGAARLATRGPLKDISNASMPRNGSKPRPPSMPGSVKKLTSANVLGTPNFLDMRNFKRRPRQPSLLSMVQRAGSRQNSVTADAPTEIEADDGEENWYLGADDEIEKDNGYKKQEAENEGQETKEKQSLKRKRYVQEVEERLYRSPTLNSTTRQDSNCDNDAWMDYEVQVEDSQPKRIRTHESESLSNASHCSSSPPLPRLRNQRASSSRRLQRTPRTPELAPSPLSTPSTSPAPQSSQLAPAEPKPQRSKPFTTAELQALLPKRRYQPRRKARHRDELQILSVGSHNRSREQDLDPSSNDEDPDADELAAPSRSRTRDWKRDKPARTSNVYAKGSTSKGKTKDAGKTYGGKKSHEACDEDGDGTADEQESSVLFKEDDSKARKEGKTREIEAVKTKFAEVDDWELSFESVDVGGRSSSPWR